MTTEPSHLDAIAQAALVRDGEMSAIEAVDAAIERVEKLNGELNAVIHPLYERARAAALGRLPDGPLRGVPIVVKDLDGMLAGAPYHGGNTLLRQLKYIAPHTSYIFEKLEQAGCVIIGKTNTPEFGLMPTTEPLAHGPSRNPWHTAHSTGGSSGGSAAAVASGMVALGHAGDGGGSIRIPAGHCGLFGLKPTRGRVSLGPDEGEAWAGFVARHVVTRSVRDSALVLDVLQGYMTGDPYTAPLPARPYHDEVGVDPGQLRIGLRTHAMLGIEVDPECVAAAEDAARLLESLGHSVEPVSPASFDEPDLMDLFAAVMLSSLRAEVMELEAIAGRPITEADVEPMTWMMYDAAGGYDAGAYLTALNATHRWVRRTVSWWLDDGFDLMLTPTCAEPAPVIGDIGDQSDGGIQASGRCVPFAVFTAPFNITGQPAMSVPTYFSASGLPVGVQLAAAPYREDLLLRVAAQIESARPWADRRPAVHA